MALGYVLCRSGPAWRSSSLLSSLLRLRWRRHCRRLWPSLPTLPPGGRRPLHDRPGNQNLSTPPRWTGKPRHRPPAARTVVRRLIHVSSSLSPFETCHPSRTLQPAEWTREVLCPSGHINVPVKTQWLRSAPTQSESAEVSRLCWLSEGRDERAYPGGPVQGSCRVTVRAPQRAQVGQSSAEEEDTRSNSPRIRILVSMSFRSLEAADAQARRDDSDPADGPSRPRPHRAGRADHAVPLLRDEADGVFVVGTTTSLSRAAP